MAGRSRALEDFESLLNTKTEEELLACSRKLVRALGFDHFLYGIRQEVAGEKPFEFVLSGYPGSWRERYVKEDYQQIDPTLAHCFTSVLPTLWSAKQYATPQQKRLMEEAQAQGLRSGLSIPIHGSRREMGILSLASGNLPTSDERARLQQTLPESHLLSVFLHEAVQRIVMPKKADPERHQLTARELECLKWAAEGKTSWETGQIIHCTERTVNFHISNVIQKLKVSNRRQAVAKAVGLGMIKG